ASAPSCTRVRRRSGQSNSGDTLARPAVHLDCCVESAPMAGPSPAGQPPAPRHPPPPAVAGRAWLAVALLVPVALLNYLDRQMLASMKFSVMRDVSDIGLEANWGGILAFFQWV